MTLSYRGGQGLFTYASTFTETGERFLRAAGSTTRILAKQMAIAEHAMVEVGKPILERYTPVETGALQASTEGVLSVGDQAVSSDPGAGSGLGAITQQVHISFAQPAHNAQGTEYGPFVVLGHHTRSGSWVPPNPGPLGSVGGPAYPIEAQPEMRAAMNEILGVMGREIAAELAQDMGQP